jgi:hypothetical protein
MRRLIVGVMASAMLYGGAAGRAAAGFIHNSTGIANPAETITFSEHLFAPGTPVTTQYAGLGVTFAPNLWYASQPPPPFSPHVDPLYLTNFPFPNLPPFNFNDPFSIHFNAPRTAAAFALITNPGFSTFTALRNGKVVETDTASTDLTSPSNFYGFSGIAFDEIQVGTAPLMSAGIDNLQLGAVSAVSAPRGLVLAGVGVLCLVAYTWRRRQAVALGPPPNESWVG